MEGVYSNEEYSKAYTELLIILKSISHENLIKIPRDILQFYINNRDKNHEFKYNKNLDFKEQNIMHLTIILFANLYSEYWATDERKEEIKKQDKEELLRLEKEKQEVYSYENLFKKRKDNLQNRSDEVSLMVIQKKNIFSRIVEKVKKILKLT